MNTPTQDELSPNESEDPVILTARYALDREHAVETDDESEDDLAEAGLRRSRSMSDIASVSFEIGPVYSPNQRRLVGLVDLNTVEGRMETFKPLRLRHAREYPEFVITHLASSGFFYLGDERRVQCYSCELVLNEYDWKDIQRVHQRERPRCEMVSYDMIVKTVVMSASIKRMCHSTVMGQMWDSFLDKKTLTEYHKLLHPCFQPLISAMVDMQKRVASYPEDWEVVGEQLDPVQLACAGFFYWDDGIVKCFYCGGMLQKFGSSDNPFEEHARHFPHCEFVQRNMGCEYIYDVLAHVHHLSCVSCFGDSRSSSVRVNNTSRGMLPVQTTKRDECKICLNQSVEMVFFPCAHVCTCGDCARASHICPICRAAIHVKTRIYLA